MPKATTSLSVVMVIDTPACFITWPICSGTERLRMSGERFLSVPSMTNISSIPIPKNDQ